jgi:hypothetical protein
MNLFCPSIATTSKRMMVCVGMLCADDMCAFHALYIERERWRKSEGEKDRKIDEKKITPYR